MGMSIHTCSYGVDTHMRMISGTKVFVTDHEQKIDYISPEFIQYFPESIDSFGEYNFDESMSFDITMYADFFKDASIRLLEQ